jgi:catechol 2,3-dioxygenase-like lactoylglutathione lyase family enzyme
MEYTPYMTHIALRVKNIEASAAFYKKYVNLDVVAARKEHTTRVAWLGNPQVKQTFVIVLLEMPYEQSRQPSFDHIGLDLRTRDKVDEMAAIAREDGTLALEPNYLGPVAGYLCMVRDPDGNMVEFSAGQDVGGTFHNENE